MRSKNDTKVVVRLYFLHQTAAAILVNDDGDLEEGVWLPKSQIDWDEDDYERGDEIDVVVPKWLLEKKGLGSD